MGNFNHAIQGWGYVACQPDAHIFSFNAEGRVSIGQPCRCGERRWGVATDSLSTIVEPPAHPETGHP
jgi:hypothetical protein